MREPLLAPFVAIAAGIVCAKWVPFARAELLWWIFALGGLTVAAVWIRAQKIAGVSCLCAFVLSGCLVALVHRMPSPPELTTGDLEPVILSGCVVEPGFVSRNRDQFTLELDPGARVRVNFYLQPGQIAPDVRYGERVEFSAKTRRPRNYRNPGDFDNVHFLARQSVFWTASILPGETITTLPGRCGSRFWAAIYSVRTAALGRIAELYEGNAYNIAMMEATLIGESSGLEKVWTEDYRSTGTFHALVISGGHVAVLAGFFLFLLRLCFVPREWATVLTVLAAWFYCFITGWQAPVIRSATGMTLFALGRCFYRQGRMLNILAATALIFIVCDPEQLFDASFQLSFLSVGLIAVLVIPIVERTSGPVAEALSTLGDDRLLEPRAAQMRVELELLLMTIRLLIPKFPLRAFTFPLRFCLYFYELLLTSAVIQIGLALPMALYFHRVSFSGLSANAIVVPLLSLAVPFGFVAIAMNFEPAARVAGLLLDLSSRTVAWHAQREPSLRIPDPPLWLAIAFSAALIWTAWRWRWGWVRVVGGLIAVGLLAVIVWHPFPPIIAARTLELTAIDVGQGDSLLVVFPDGRTMLMDAGGIPAFGAHIKAKIDIGEDVVSPYLWTRSMKRLDIVAISHAHDDHVGGIPAILENFRPRELWTGATPTGPPWDAIREKAKALGITIRPLHRGDHLPYTEVLAPSREYVMGRVAKNNDSLVLRLTYGRHSFVLTGDMEKQVENDLLANGLVTHADVLKVGHHGSKTSSQPGFLDAVHPAFGLISVGYENSYGHPSHQTLDNLAERRVEVLRTDESGLITIRTDGRQITIP